MKRRQFIKQTASVAGLSFVGCGLGSTLVAEEHSHPGHRREVMVNGKRMLTVDIHCHSYVHDVWPLISEQNEIPYLRPLLGNEALINKLDVNNVDFRLQQMDQQGIDIQAVSLHVGQYHHWADRDLAAEIVRIQNDKIAELCALHPDRFVGLGAIALQHPDLAVQQMNHAISQLDMRGFMITGSVDGGTGEPAFSPVLGCG